MSKALVDLSELFEECNQQYFNGELLPIHSIYWSSRLKLMVARASLVEINDEHKITLGLSYHIADDPVRCKSVMVHEQIHVLAYQKYLQTGNEMYLDLEGNGIEGFTPGHGEFFHRIASVLNSHHPELNICASDDDYFSKNIKSGAFHFVEIRFARAEEERVSVFYTDRPIGQKRISDILGPIEDLYGRQSLISIELLKTKDPIVTNFSRLTSKFDLRKNQVPIHYSEETLALLKNVHTVSLDRVEFEPISEEKKSLAQSLVQHRKSKHQNFSDYMMSVVGKDVGLNSHLGVTDVATFMNLDQDTINLIYGEWKSIRASEIMRSPLYYETLAHESMGDEFEESALRALVDFGVNRIKIPEFLSMIKADSLERYPVTLLEDSLKSLEGVLKRGVRQRELESRSLYIGMDKNSYVVGCILSKMNDGFRVSGKDEQEFMSNWDKPTISNIASSLHIRNNLDVIFSDVLPLYLNKGLTQAGRAFDSIVSGWGTFISRDINPSQIAGVIQGRLEQISLRNKAYGRGSASLDSGFKVFAAAMFDSAISHCYGGSEMRKRRPDKKPNGQMDIFG
jgi:hypothetical protein